MNEQEEVVGREETPSSVLQSHHSSTEDDVSEESPDPAVAVEISSVDVGQNLKDGTESLDSESEVHSPAGVEEMSRPSENEVITVSVTGASEATAAMPAAPEKSGVTQPGSQENIIPAVPPLSQASPAPGPGYGLPFPPFLVNPFMAPYLPQPQYGGFGQNSEEQVEANREMDPGFQYNPYSGGYFLTPTQYQEMMQQYLQSVLAAGGAAMSFPSGAGLSPASEPGDVIFDDTKECTEALKRTKLLEGGRQHPWYPSYPLPMGWPPVQSSVAPTHNLEASTASATQFRCAQPSTGQKGAGEEVVALFELLPPPS